MTDRADRPEWVDGAPRVGVAARLAHLLGPVAVIVFAVRVADWFGVAPGWIWTGSTVVSVAIWAMAWWHHQSGRLCERCLHETPRNAPTWAQRWRWLLWYEHFAMTRWWLFAYVLAGAGAAGVHWWATSTHTGGGVLSGHWLLAPLDIAWVLMLFGVTIHHRLTPWCPYCPRWDDGGDHEETPTTPTPNPTGARTA